MTTKKASDHTRIRPISAIAILLLTAGGAWGLPIPRPGDSLLPPPPLPAAEPSVLRLDVVIPVSDLQKSAEKAFPEVIEQKEWLEAAANPFAGRAEYRYRVDRGPVTVVVAPDENGLRIRMPEMRLNLTVRWYPPIGKPVEMGCGEGGPLRFSVAALTRLSWSNDWALQTDTRFEALKLLDPCRIGPGEFDAASLIQKLLDSQLEELAAAVDEKVREQSAIRDLVGRVWTRMSEPSELSDEVWLTMGPVAASAADPEVTSGRLAATLAITLNPVVATGERPAAQKGRLPQLSVTPAIPDGIHIILPVRTTWPVITERLSSSLKGQTMDLNESKSITIEELEVYGSDDRVIVRLGVSGAVTGDLYVAGIPAIEAGSSTFFLRESDFTIDTGSVLAKMASTVARQKILKAIQENTRIDLEPRLADIRSRVAGAMTQSLGGGWRLDGSVTKLRTREVYPTRDGIELRVVLDGRLEVRPE